jgi:hypothetical protein
MLDVHLYTTVACQFAYTSAYSVSMYISSTIYDHNAIHVRKYQEIHRTQHEI